MTLRGRCRPTLRVSTTFEGRCRTSRPESFMVTGVKTTDGARKSLAVSSNDGQI